MAFGCFFSRCHSLSSNGILLRNVCLLQYITWHITDNLFEQLSHLRDSQEVTSALFLCPFLVSVLCSLGPISLAIGRHYLHVIRRIVLLWCVSLPLSFDCCCCCCCSTVPCIVVNNMHYMANNVR